MSLVQKLIKEEYLKTDVLVNAFREVDRRDFLVPEFKHLADENIPLPIGCGQTISQPLTVAFMLELLQPQTGDHVLDVGSGSGWTCTLLAKAVGEEGRVCGIERVEELRAFAVQNITKYNLIREDAVKVFCSDGYDGLPQFAPFDKILVSATASSVPKELVKQLRPGGRMVIPIGGGFSDHSIVVIEKTGEYSTEKTEYPGFVFVPLVRD